MADDELTMLPPRSPAKFDAELARLLDRLRQANSTEELVDIDEEAEHLEAWVNLYKLGWQAHLETVLLQVKCLLRVYQILEERPRQPVGRPPRNLPGGNIFKPTLAQLRVPHAMYKKARRLGVIPPWIVHKVIQDYIDQRKEFTVGGLIQKCEAEVQVLRNLEPQVGGRTDDLHELIRRGQRFGTI